MSSDVASIHIISKSHIEVDTVFQHIHVNKQRNTNMSRSLFVFTIYFVEVACKHFNSSTDFNRSLFLDEVEVYQTMLRESIYDTPTKDKVVYPREEDYGSMSFHNVTWLSSHNAHANNFAAGGNFV